MTQIKPKGDDGALALRPRPAEPWGDSEWQKLWLSLRNRDWSSLAVVPAGVGAPVDFTLTIAVTLARVGAVHLGAPIQVADATRIPLAQLMQFNEELERMRQDEEYVLLALAPIDENPISVSLAQSADAAILCVLMDCMKSGDAKETVERIGPTRFAGSVIFHPEGR